MFDLIAPAAELVNLVQEHEARWPFLGGAASHGVEVPAEDASERGGLFAQQLEIETHEQDVSPAHTGGKKVLDDLVDARCLPHLTRASDDLDESFRAT